MRLSTAYAYNQSITNLQDRQQELSRSQTQLTSGKRVNAASDDPTAAARAERALASIARNDTDKRALDASRNAMGIAESALGDAADLLQSARETMVAAGNGTYSDGEREALAKKLVEIRKQLLSIANRPDGSGGYVFGGQGLSTTPFTEVSNTAPGTVTFNGQRGSIQASSSEQVSLTIDGQRTWMQGRDEAGNLVNVNVFDAMTTAIDGLRMSNPTSTDITNTVTNGLGDIDKVLGNMQSARAEVGEALNRMDGIESRIGTLKLAAQSEQSNAEDLDMVEAISNFQGQQTGYDAALRSYAAVQKLSLFQYIS
ncbi:flagellar hook-associated protein FlgL [Aquabacterium sp.]|uniref:flagellar hook-associated protein FlgL n=1 Tax=Aquabacterium sp. TaxID=1872578 RepID=UPI0025BE3164|nr:flagellar hook-associated protein FlgL [Aquabacterium sp.]